MKDVKLHFISIKARITNKNLLDTLKLAETLSPDIKRPAPAIEKYAIPQHTSSNLPVPRFFFFFSLCLRHPSYSKFTGKM
jgi:hypothetical protein